MTTYLLVFHTPSPQRYNAVEARVKTFKHWIACFPGAWLIRTRRSQSEISDRVRSALTSRDSMIMCEVTLDQMGGYLTQEVWDWMENA